MTQKPPKLLAAQAADATTVPAKPPPPALPIVAIGASAGGLEALEQFLGHVPPGSGMAFVVIQHLDPTHKGMLPELLQRVTPMPVTQATDRLKVQPDHVYVIPPNKDLSILRGALHLFEPAAPRGLRLPIDFFFRSLAEDRCQASVGVILSGMGSDGTLGLRAIKEKGGLTLVQDPATAKFDAMPRSVIDAGLADCIAPADALPERLSAALRHCPPDHAPPDNHSQSALEKVLILLRSQIGHDFSLYKKNTLYRRIERRMGLHLIDRLPDYVRFLRENPQETRFLFRELLIGVTRFFRDPDAWELLQTQVLPAQFAELGERTHLRAWVSACSSGEEAYTLAIVFKEALEALEPRRLLALQIYATDLDAEAIDIARRGVYPPNIAADVTPERLSRFFVPVEHGYRVSKDIRNMVIFAPQNLIADPPFTKLDLLTCRNLLIYLSPELQQKLVPLFHYSLNPGGTLFLGSAESTGDCLTLFTPIDAKLRLYRRTPQTRPLAALEFPTTATLRLAANPPDSPLPEPPLTLQASADRLVLERCSPTVVLTNPQGDILYINGRTANYLELASGKANWNLHAMVREGLRLDLLTACQQALRQPGQAICRPALCLTGVQGLPLWINLNVEALEQPGPLRGMLMLVFQERPAPAPASPPDAHARPRRGARAVAVDQEVQRLTELLQATHEEMQTSQEELKSTNEELQSTNEELQSANEELTTSQEEMQSLNEELQTVNAELQAKVHDLSLASNDMHNLLNSTEIATVFLDNALQVRRYTPPATRIIKLIPGDVGRPLSDLSTDLCYPELSADAQEVLRTLVFSEKDVETHDGRWYTVRIMPYRTTDNLIDGVVITFIDISVAKQLEARLRLAGNGPGSN